MRPVRVWDLTVLSPLCAVRGIYMYMAHLRAIDGKRLVGPAAAWPDIQGWSQIMTPMVASKWERLLASHPDDAYSAYLMRGLRDSFRIGFGYGSTRCRSAVSNMQSAGERPSMIDTFLATKLAVERVLGLVDPGLAGSIQVNRFGLVKGQEPDKWRLIVDLSFPGGSSVNDGIGPELCMLHYTSVDAACQRVLELGQGTVLAKFDVSGAFGWSQSTSTTVTCWVCSGGATLMWIKCCLLASGRPPSCTMWWQMAYYGFW